MIAKDVYRALGLTDAEYDEIREVLGREASACEVAMYSVMWSEHCSYKSSRVHLARLPTEAPHVLVGPGENAGVVDVGGGLAVALRIESHNHPSFVEPYQGAATGVGGILRDVFTMGARPIALFDPLRFGPLDDPRNRYLLEGVVAGISGYGNAVGVPTVGGDLQVDACYSGNPLVNVGCIGLVPTDRIVLARATTSGSRAVLLGSATGRDGIGGASVLASARFEEGAAGKRPAVQVGDPYGEKRLIEACLEMLDAGVLEGLQDLGAAGLTGATSETAARGGRGMDVDVAAVPRREPGMSPTEVMVSESQERMLAIVAADDVEVVTTICAKWEVHAAVVGTVTDTGRLRIFDGGELVADTPAPSLADEGPRYLRPLAPPADLAAKQEQAPPVPDPGRAGDDLLRLLAEPGICDAQWIWRQYDHQLFLNTVAGPGQADAAVLRLKGRPDGLAVAVDGNARWGAVDPRAGSALAVSEACRNVACTGGRPLALVNNLNFGDPEVPEVMWQLSEAVDGVAEACRVLGVPVVGGNVSLYNATGGTQILPTPTVMVLGHIADLAARIPGLGLPRPGLALVMLGADAGEYGGSAWAWVVAGHRDGAPPRPRLDAEAALGDTLRAVAAAGLAAAAHDVSEGGLAVCLAEMALTGGIGFTVDVAAGTLFSETPARAVVATADPAAVVAIAEGHHVSAAVVGESGGPACDYGSAGVDLEAAAAAWRGALPAIMR